MYCNLYVDPKMENPLVLTVKATEQGIFLLVVYEVDKKSRFYKLIFKLLYNKIKMLEKSRRTNDGTEESF